MTVISGGGAEGEAPSGASSLPAFSSRSVVLKLVQRSSLGNRAVRSAQSRGISRDISRMSSPVYPAESYPAAAENSRRKKRVPDSREATRLDIFSLFLFAVQRSRRDTFEHSHATFTVRMRPRSFPERSASSLQRSSSTTSN